MTPFAYRAVDPHGQIVQGRLDAADESQPRLLGGRQDAGGEHGGVRGGEDERCPAHRPGLQQGPVDDGGVQALLRHALDARVQGQQR